MLYLWGLEAIQQQSLFAETEEMFEIITLIGNYLPHQACGESV